MNEGGDTKDDLQLPSGTDEAEKLAVQLKADFEAGKELQVSVMKVRKGCSCCCCGLWAAADTSGPGFMALVLMALCWLHAAPPPRRRLHAP